MITAGIREVKNNLSRYLTQVKAGEEVVITDRGLPVARIVKENQRNKGIRNALLPLIRNGVITLPGKRINRENLGTVKSHGKFISEMVIEDRR